MELQGIVRRIEQAEVDVDELKQVVKRGALLVGFCRAKLHGTQAAVESALEGLKSEPTAPGPATPSASVFAAIKELGELDPFADE